MSQVPTPPYLADALTAMPSPFSRRHAGALEAELTSAYGVDHAIAVSSGTAALQAALVGCGAGPGKQVLVPALTVVMTVAAVAATGAHPVFVDCPPGRFGLDLQDAADKLTESTVALVPVHFGGRTGDLTAIAAFAEDAGIALVEDACQAQGSLWNGRPAGTLDTGCFSLKDGKILSCGEGGYILTRDPSLAARAAAFRTHWQTGTLDQPAGTALGHNLRLAEPLAALARHSLAQRDAATKQRRAQTALLAELVGDVPGLTCVPAEPGETPNGYSALWTIDRPDPRGLCGRLAGLGVANSTGTFGLKAAHAHPACQRLNPAVCQHAQHLVDSLLSVPLTSADTDDRIGRLAEMIRTEVARWH